MIQWASVLIWWVMLEIIGIIALPLVTHLCKNLADKGYSVSKIFGLLLLTYFSWVFGTGFRYDRLVVYLALGTIGVLSLVIYRKNGLELHKDTMIKNEMLFTTAFLIFVMIRAYSPEIWWTAGEKFMDFGFIQAILRSTSFPPYDPWFAGEAMQYYYFGYLVVANMIQLSWVKPSVAFNLAVATMFALSVNAAFGIGYNLTKRMRYGVVTTFLAVIMGNTLSFFQLVGSAFFPEILESFGASMSGNIWERIASFNYWSSSRIIPNTINEFPFFSFLHGDLHPHMISIAFQLLVIVLLLSVFKNEDRSLKALMPDLGVLSICVGFMYPLNSWEFPTYLLLTAMVLVFRQYRLSKIQDIEKAEVLLACAGVCALSWALYIPFHMRLHNGIGLVLQRTEIQHYLVIYALLLFLMYSYLIARVLPSVEIRWKWMLAWVLLLGAISFVLQFQLLVMLIPLTILSLISLLRERNSSMQFVSLLILVGALLSLFCEIFFIKDQLSVQYHRMNTVFKLGVQNWLFWSIAGGFSIYHFRDWFVPLKANTDKRRVLWTLVACSLILACSVYPVAATYGKSGRFKGDLTLDGARYVERYHGGESSAIQWMGQKEGAPIVLEAPGTSFQWSSRVAALTGLPTVIGWAGHEITWRRYPEPIVDRMVDVDTIYRTNNTEALRLLQKYDVKYIFIGSVERANYPAEGLVKFADHPESYNLVYENKDVQVYQVR